MSPIEILQTKIKELRTEGLLPNGANQLVYGSLVMRRQQQFLETEWKPTEEMIQDPREYNRQYADWAKRYDGFSGENLAATALYQHDRYSPEEMRFPDPASPDFSELTTRMAELGDLMRPILEKEGWQSLSSFLTSIDISDYSNE